MFRKIYLVTTLALMLVMMGIGVIGCPPNNNNNNNNGTKVQFTIKADSLVPAAHFGKVLAATHDSSVHVFTVGQAVGTEFQDFDFMNDSTTLVPALANLKGVTEVYATEDDLSGLITPNTTLTFNIEGHTDDLVSVITAQFQTLSTFAGLNAVALPATGSQQFDLPMFSLDANNKVVAEPAGTPSVRVTITRK